MRKQAASMVAFIFTSKSMGTVGWNTECLEWYMTLHTNNPLTLDSKIVSVCEVLLGETRPLLSDLAHLLSAISRKDLHVQNKLTFTSA